jgi:hypothetical protein
VTSAVATTAADFEHEQARFIAEQRAVAATAHVAPAPARTRPRSACTLCAQCACVPSVPVCLCVAHAPARTYPLRLCFVCLCVPVLRVPVRACARRLRAMAHGWGASAEAARPPWVGSPAEAALRDAVRALSRDRRNFTLDPPDSTPFPFELTAYLSTAQVRPCPPPTETDVSERVPSV